MGYKVFEVKVDDDGSIEYRLNNRLHSLGDMPAVENKTGSKFWYKEGLLHRENGPACEYKNGEKVWYKENCCHRVDGPALVKADGSKFWYYNGARIYCESQEEFEDWLGQKNHKVSSSAAASSCCDGKVVEIDGKKYKLLLVSQ